MKMNIQSKRVESYQMRGNKMYATINDLKQFDVIEYMDSVFVVSDIKREQGKFGSPDFENSDYRIIATLTNDVETIELINGYGDYFNIVNHTMPLKYFKNMNSFIIHATVASQAICGTRHGQNSQEVDRGATCKKCLELINK